MQDPINSVTGPRKILVLDLAMLDKAAPGNEALFLSDKYNDGLFSMLKAFKDQMGFEIVVTHSSYLLSIHQQENIRRLNRNISFSNIDRFSEEIGNADKSLIYFFSEDPSTIESMKKEGFINGCRVNSSIERNEKVQYELKSNLVEQLSNVIYAKLDVFAEKRQQQDVVTPQTVTTPSLRKLPSQPEQKRELPQPGVQHLTNNSTSIQLETTIRPQPLPRSQPQIPTIGQQSINITQSITNIKSEKPKEERKNRGAPVRHIQEYNQSPVDSVFSPVGNSDPLAVRGKPSLQSRTTINLQQPDKPKNDTTPRPVSQNSLQSNQSRVLPSPQTQVNQMQKANSLPPIISQGIDKKDNDKKEKMPTKADKPVLPESDKQQGVNSYLVKKEPVPFGASPLTLTAHKLYNREANQYVKNFATALYSAIVDENGINVNKKTLPTINLCANGVLSITVSAKSPEIEHIKKKFVKEKATADDVFQQFGVTASDEYFKFDSFGNLKYELKNPRELQCFLDTCGLAKNVGDIKELYQKLCEDNNLSFDEIWQKYEQPQNQVGTSEEGFFAGLINKLTL